MHAHRDVTRLLAERLKQAVKSAAFQRPAMSIATTEILVARKTDYSLGRAVFSETVNNDRQPTAISKM